MLPFSATDLLQQHIDLQTEFGQKFVEILLKGEAIPEELVIKMIEDKINSPEVAHHGMFLVLNNRCLTPLSIVWFVKFSFRFTASLS